jgi:hypothetical protein
MSRPEIDASSPPPAFPASAAGRPMTFRPRRSSVGIASPHDTPWAREDVHFRKARSAQTTGTTPNVYQLNARRGAACSAYRDLHGSDFHYKWAHSTRAHNGARRRRGPGPHSATLHGRIADYVTNGLD